MSSALALLKAIDRPSGVTLLTGAGLLLASFLRMNAKPAAFTPEKIIVMKVRLPAPQYSRAMKQRYRDELMRRIGAIPGIEAAGMISAPMMFCCTEARRFRGGRGLGL